MNPQTESKERAVLVVDDEKDVLESLALIFQSNGFKVNVAPTGSDAVECFSREPVPVVVCDNMLPDIQGISLLDQFRGTLPEVQMIMVTGKGTIDIAVQAMKAGVFDFITKPVDPEHLIQLALRANQLYEALADRRNLIEEMRRITDHDIVGKHASMKKLLRLVNTVARTESAVLIEGESGTGKELVARLIHKSSKRSGKNFVPVDCGAIPEGLVESELFGHEKGSFTGASHARQGKFERANRGTLFLDEIANLPLASQSKLLRALQEKSIERVGGRRPIPVDIRLIAASNAPLQDSVKENRFREDLFYRLNVVVLRIPPLRERKSDILELAMKFIEKHRDKTSSPVTGIGRRTLNILMEHSWPGNVRELENTIEHAMVMSQNNVILPQALPPLEVHAQGNLSVRLDDSEKGLILRAMKETGGNKYRAARRLGIARSSLYSKLKKYGITNG
jgi:two-component system response regulator AtoC